MILLAVSAVTITVGIAIATTPWVRGGGDKQPIGLVGRLLPGQLLIHPPLASSTDWLHLAGVARELCDLTPDLLQRAEIAHLEKKIAGARQTPQLLPVGVGAHGHTEDRPALLLDLQGRLLGQGVRVAVAQEDNPASRIESAGLLDHQGSGVEAFVRVGRPSLLLPYNLEVTEEAVFVGDDIDLGRCRVGVLDDPSGGGTAAELQTPSDAADKRLLVPPVRIADAARSVEHEHHADPVAARRRGSICANEERLVKICAHPACAGQERPHEDRTQRHRTITRR
mmetsp:Transcript_23452/g.62620  ORF Transcript_23452/g.62620 Transcript_23452/m.62620 type:complete len:282 (+) Transcript_23452:3848-4693(+)